ncbi:hypothetical protein GCM10029978_067280 [Actinoallomurus acanthiterrae]
MSDPPVQSTKMLDHAFSKASYSQRRRDPTAAYEAGALALVAIAIDLHRLVTHLTSQTKNAST